VSAGGEGSAPPVASANCYVVMFIHIVTVKTCACNSTRVYAQSVLEKVSQTSSHNSCTCNDADYTATAKNTSAA
jgi:hypothetical protein